MIIKKEKGSISIFVLVMLLFMSAFLLISYASNVGKSKTIKEQFNVISQIYAYGGGDEGAYDKAYTDLREKNKQTMTASSENSSVLELTKTFEDKMSNYRIYGNSIQDGTPTPDSPIEVQSVGNKVNLFNNALPYRDLDTLITTKEELLEGISQGQMIFYGIISSSVGSEIIYNRVNTTFVIVPIENNKTYAINQYSKQGLILLDENFVQVQAGATKETVITNTTNAKYLFVYVHNKAQSSTQQTWTLEDVLNGLQIEEGSESTEYVPYGKYRIPIKVTGKNLVSELIGGYPEASNFPDLSATGSLVFQTVKLKNVKAGTYTFSFEKPVNIVRSVSTSSHSSNISIPISANSNTKVVTITLAQDEEEYHLSFRDTTSASTEWNGWVQCEIGNVATEYEEYKGKTFNIYLDEPLRKLGTYIDYLDLKTGKVIRNIGYTVLSGSDMTWTAYDDNQEDVLGFYTGGLPSKSAVSRKYSLSNRFVRTETDIAPRAILGVNYETFYIVDSYFKMTVSKTRVSDLATFKTWLDENPTYIDFVLVEPTEENISLPQLSTYEDYTKIEVLTDVAPSKIETEYIGYTLEGN